ncbi:MAG: T9SS type A sorting domain-containing protein [Bacteroidetes bacterium]|nr:T9SS type A sorting domain-containing protein [Bacteroidota bacterium]
MKKTLTTFILLFHLALTFKAQIVFCPPGAEWHHTFTMLGMPPVLGTVQNHTTKYIKDSIMGVDTVKVLQHTRFFKECNSTNAYLTLIKQKGDTVFMKNAITQNTWQILYNFAALPGHSWKNSLLNSNSTIRTYTITVDTVKFITVNSFTLKQLVVKYNFNLNSNIVSETAKITERFGCDQFLFNYHNETYGLCDYDYFSEFLCYQDSTFGLKQFTNKPCDYNITVGIKENSNISAFNLLPNPADTKLRIELLNDQHITKALILNNLGQIVLDKEIDPIDKEISIDIQKLPDGFYTLKLLNTSRSNIALSKRFIIAR